METLRAPARQVGMTAYILIAIAQGADVVTFAATSAVYPIAGEQNGIAASLYRADGIFGVELYKLILLVGMLGVVSLLRRAPAWARVAGVTVPVALGLAGAAANLAVLFAR